MDELQLLPGIQDLKEVVHAYSLPETSKKHSRLFLEVKELGLPKSSSIMAICSDQDATSLKNAFKSLKHVKNDSFKTVVQTLKKNKKLPETIYVDMGQKSLYLGIHVRPATLVLRLSDYIWTKTQSRLIYLISSSYESVRLIKPLVIPEIESTMYVVAAGVKSQSRSGDEKVLFDKLSSVERMNVVNVFPDLKVPSDYTNSLASLNRQFIAQEIKATAQLYNFVKSKDYYGTRRDTFMQNKKEMEQQWLEAFKI